MKRIKIEDGKQLFWREATGQYEEIFSEDGTPYQPFKEWEVELLEESEWWR